MSLVTRGLGNDAILVTWGLGQKALVPDYGPWTPTPFAATAILSAAYGGGLAVSADPLSAVAVLSASGLGGAYTTQISPLGAATAAISDWYGTLLQVSGGAAAGTALGAGFPATYPAQAGTLVSGTSASGSWAGEILYTGGSLVAGGSVSASSLLASMQAQASYLQAGTVLSTTYPTFPYLVSPSEMAAVTIMSGIFGTNSSAYQAGTLLARAFISAEYPPFYISPPPISAGASVTAIYLLQGLVAQATACVARTGASANTIKYFHGYISELYRANLPQEVVDTSKARKPVRIPDPEDLHKLRHKLPDKLPTLDHW